MINHWFIARGLLAWLSLVGGLAGAPVYGNPSLDSETAVVSDPDGSTMRQRQPYELVEPFTAGLLTQGEFKLGGEFAYGLSPAWNLGTDVVAAVIGVPSLQLKYLAAQWGNSQLSVALGVAYFDKSMILWGNMDEHFSHLRARVLKPGLSYSRHLSHRLSIHTHWTTNIGRIEAELSETGRRRLWESKHPGVDYESRAEAPVQESDNKAAIRSDSFAQRTMQVSSITGMASELFQFTGEFRRANGNKILLSNRMERIHIEQLRANSFRLTAAQQWVWSYFQFRIGVGLQYVTIHGSDLDGEVIDEAGLLPASDVEFYWRF